MHNNKRLIFILLISCGCLAACESDSKDYSQQILGYWEVDEAYREGNLTATLQDAYFDFRPEGQLEFNLDGSTQSAAYHIEGSRINVQGSRMDGDYQIQSISDTSMILMTTLRDFKFQFNLSKAQE